MSMMKTAKSLLLLPLLLMLAGCGYALVGKGSNIPDDVKSVYLQPLQNKTQRQQVEQELTQAIAMELVTRQRFAVVGNAAEATAEIDGAVTGFAVTPVTFDNTGRATTYEISITAQIVFKRGSSSSFDCATTERGSAFVGVRGSASLPPKRVRCWSTVRR